MADGVTLLPCPMCGGTDIRIAHLSASPEQSIWCHSCQLRTKWCYRDDAIAAWNTRVPDPRVAELEGELAKSRAWRATLADTGDELLAELRDAQEALSTSGIGGIYDTLQDVGDAIRQMAAYIKERDARIAELEAALAAGREGTCETCTHAHEYEGALSCGLTESGRAIAHMMDCSYWEPKEDA